MTLTELRKWAADDFLAATHQSMGQYRTALLRVIDEVIALAAAAPAPTERIRWSVTGAGLKLLAQEFVRAAECMGDDEDEMVLELRKPGTIEGDDRQLNEGHVLAVSLAEEPDEGVYPIDPADPTAGREDPAPVAPVGEREAFEAWHRQKFQTKYMTGQPTRDIHNGVYDEQYGPAIEQDRWETWQAARQHQNGDADAMDATRFRGMMATLVAVMNDSPLTPTQARMHGMLDSMEDMYDVDPDHDFDTWSEPAPIERGKFVYCSQSCAAIDAARRRGRKAAETALIELVETKYPGAVATHVHVYGDRIEQHDGHCSATFTFPGGKYAATWRVGDGIWVSQCDQDAWTAYRGDAED